MRKLVRHRLPAQAMARGAPMLTCSINDVDELRALLAEKLLEEAGEFRDKPSLDELADVFEVLQCLLTAHGWSVQHLEARWAHKRRERGGILRGALAMGAIAYLGDPIQPGDHVMVMVEGQPTRALVLRAEQDPQNLHGFRWHTTPVAGGRTGAETYETEGVEWARGWSDETAGALAAAYALAEPRR